MIILRVDYEIIKQNNKSQINGILTSLNLTRVAKRVAIINIKTANIRFSDNRNENSMNVSKQFQDRETKYIIDLKEQIDLQRAIKEKRERERDQNREETDSSKEVCIRESKIRKSIASEKTNDENYEFVCHNCENKVVCRINDIFEPKEEENQICTSGLQTPRNETKNTKDKKTKKTKKKIKTKKKKKKKTKKIRILKDYNFKLHNPEFFFFNRLVYLHENFINEIEMPENADYPENQSLRSNTLSNKHQGRFVRQLNINIGSNIQKLGRRPKVSNAKKGDLKIMMSQKNKISRKIPTIVDYKDMSDLHKEDDTVHLRMESRPSRPEYVANDSIQLDDLLPKITSLNQMETEKENKNEDPQESHTTGSSKSKQMQNGDNLETIDIDDRQKRERKTSTVMIEFEEEEENEEIKEEENKEEKEEDEEEAEEELGLDVVRDLIKIFEQPDEDFKIIKKNKKITLGKIANKESPVVLVRAKAWIEADPDLIFTLLHDIKIRDNWDSVICDLKIIDTYDDTTDVLYSRFKASMGATDRDFVQIRKVTKNKFGYNSIIAMRSIEHKRCPPMKKRIRANTMISGYIVKQEGDKCLLGIISQTDIKGMVPRFIINALAPRKPQEWVRKLEKAIKMYGGTAN